MARYTGYTTKKTKSKDKTCLKGKRYIHLKKEVPKFFEHIVTSAAKPKIVENMSPFQIGAVPGHRSQEHLFSVKSVIAMLEEHDEAGAIQLFDLVAFFDCEMLEDVLGELYSKSQIKGKLY